MTSRLAEPVIDALWALHAKAMWQPGEDVANLEACKATGHLHPEATLNEIDEMIEDEAVADINRVFYDHAESEPRGIIVFRRVGHNWIIRFTMDGTVEATRPLLDANAYLARRNIEYLGTVGELLG